MEMWHCKHMCWRGSARRGLISAVRGNWRTPSEMWWSCICLLAVLANRRCENKQEYSCCKKYINISPCWLSKHSGDGLFIWPVFTLNQCTYDYPAWTRNEEMLKGRTKRCQDTLQKVNKLHYDRHQCWNFNHGTLQMSGHQCTFAQNSPTQTVTATTANKAWLYKLIASHKKKKKKIFFDRLMALFVTVRVLLCILVCFGRVCESSGHRACEQQWAVHSQPNSPISKHCR